VDLLEVKLHSLVLASLLVPPRSLGLLVHLVPCTRYERGPRVGQLRNEKWCGEGAERGESTGLDSASPPLLHDGDAPRLTLRLELGRRENSQGSSSIRACTTARINSKFICTKWTKANESIYLPADRWSEPKEVRREQGRAAE
jgi:hypothetical protein